MIRLSLLTEETNLVEVKHVSKRVCIWYEYHILLIVCNWCLIALIKDRNIYNLGYSKEKLQINL